MRLIVLEICASIFALLFLATLAATALHRARYRAGGAYPASALTEYIWTVVPWLMVVAAALPAVRLIVAERGEAAREPPRPTIELPLPATPAGSSSRRVCPPPFFVRSQRARPWTQSR